MDKKLFELNENTTPADSKRLAFGDASSGAENITLANFYTRLMSKLGFLKVANRLSEYYGNPALQADVHEFINVYSKKQVDDKDALKANKSNVIEKDSTTTYTPTLATHPVNKNYVDSKFISGRTIDLGEPSGNQTFIIPIGKTMTNNTYKVLITMVGNSTAMYAYSVIDKTTTTFSIHTDEASGIGQGNFYFDWLIIPN